MEAYFISHSTVRFDYQIGSSPPEISLPVSSVGLVFPRRLISFGVFVDIGSLGCISGVGNIFIGEKLRLGCGGLFLNS